MVDSLVSARRFLKAMFAATARSECLGLVLAVNRPSEVGRTWPTEDGVLLREVVGPYLGLVRAVPAGLETTGVVLPEGVRVLAEGLDAHNWPGSEAAFRDELGSPAPSSWNRRLHRWDRAWRADVGRRANTEIAWYFGVESRNTPAVVVLDPNTRRGLVLDVPRGTGLRSFCERLVVELGGWPHRRLAVVESLATAHLELATLTDPAARTVVELNAETFSTPDRGGDLQRAVRLARQIEALSHADLLTPPRYGDDDDRAEKPSVNGHDLDERAVLRTRIGALRAELDRGDRAVATADAAVRAARHGFGDLHGVELAAPDTFVGWRFERLRAPGTLRRIAGGAGAGLRLRT